MKLAVGLIFLSLIGLQQTSQAAVAPKTAVVAMSYGAFADPAPQLERSLRGRLGIPELSPSQRAAIRDRWTKHSSLWFREAVQAGTLQGVSRLVVVDFRVQELYAEFPGPEARLALEIIRLVYRIVQRRELNVNISYGHRLWYLYSEPEVYVFDLSGDEPQYHRIQVAEPTAQSTRIFGEQFSSTTGYGSAESRLIENMAGMIVNRLASR